MPTAKARISVTLEPDLAAVLRRLSELTGNSQSALVGELLQSSFDVFERMTVILEAAARLKEQGLQVTDEVRDGLKATQDRLEEQLGLVLTTYQEGSVPILDLAEKLGRREAALAAPAGAATPLSNRGVTPHQKGRKPTTTAHGGR